MFKRLVSKIGKTTHELSIAFMHGYNSADRLEVVAKINHVDKVEVETPEVEVEIPEVEVVV